MKTPTIFLLLATCFVHSSAIPSPQTDSLTTSSTTKKCTTYNSIPLTVTSTNQIFSGPKFSDNYDLTDFTTDQTSRTANITFHPFGSPALNETKTTTYTLAGTFCTPSRPNDKTSTVLLLTHGLNFNRAYWDPSIQPSKYSFVDAAIEKGYSVFFYDRLGVGKSQKVSGYVNQYSIQVALGVAITKAVKGGEYTGRLGKPKKVVLVGHSYGSGISAGVVSAVPKGLVDGLVLTGFSFAGGSAHGFVQASQFRIASGERPLSWGGLDTGYVTPVDIYANINAFFKKPNYSQSIAQYAELTKEPIAIAEVLTAADLNPIGLYAFEGAAMLIAGQYDFVFCASLCDGVIDAAASVFAGEKGHAKAYKAVSYPGAGHGLNFALNAKRAFEIVLGFVDENV